MAGFVFFGCSLKDDLDVAKVDEYKAEIVIEDLLNVPQDVRVYTSGINKDELYDSQKNYEKSYFSVWNIEEPPYSLESVQWPFKSFSVEKSYAENMRPMEKDFFDEMYEQSNFDKYATLNKKAVSLKYSNIRALPTFKPLLLDPSLPGEGFPFDYLQNSSVNANTPLFISHYSKDKQWVYVFSSFANGWLRSSEVVFIDENHADMWQEAKQILITKEGVPLFTESGKPLFNTRIGMMFALVGETDDSYIILTVSSYKMNVPMFNKSLISKDIASKDILKLNKENLNRIVKEVAKTNYGWGGIYEQRDCSSTIMDIYSAFGIWLPRNSSKQGRVGEVIDLSSLSDSEKIETIKEKGVPFETLIYKKGHIVIYVGTYNDEVVILHNTWGIKTKDKEEEGRFIVGKTVFSTLKFGDELENYDYSSGLLKNIQSMNIITK